VDPAELRAKEFGALAGRSYLDHALRGPIPARAVDASQEAIRLAALGSVARSRQLESIEWVRARLARLLAWAPEQVSFTLNTTTAIAILAQSVRWVQGDRVLVHEDEVLSNVLPWKALGSRGVAVESIPSRDGRLVLDDVVGSLRRGRVRVLSFASVALGTGQRRDLTELGRLAREHGALLCVDAAQSLGALRLDLGGVDAVCASGRKWLLGPPEVGILALRPGLEGDLEVSCAGTPSRSVDGSWVAGARRFEGGALPSVAITGLGASLSLLEEIGERVIEERVLANAARTRELAEAAGLAIISPGGAESSGIVHIQVPGAPLDLEERLSREGVVARAVGDRLRISPHFWNTSDDLERLFEALARVR